MRHARIKQVREQHERRVADLDSQYQEVRQRVRSVQSVYNIFHANTILGEALEVSEALYGHAGDQRDGRHEVADGPRRDRAFLLSDRVIKSRLHSTTHRGSSRVRALL